LSNNYNINKLKNHDKVFIKHFEDMGHVYIIKDAKLFNEMMCKIIQDRCKSYYEIIFNIRQLNKIYRIFFFFSAAIKYHFKVGDIVKVNTKNSDYRAKIKKIDDNLITVMTIDIGCCKEVPSNCIYELSEELAKV
jgi:phosphoenolpyruvate-protein kinase (PTS system EI component)